MSRSTSETARFSSRPRQSSASRKGAIGTAKRPTAASGDGARVTKPATHKPVKAANATKATTLRRRPQSRKSAAPAAVASFATNPPRCEKYIALSAHVLNFRTGEKDRITLTSPIHDQRPSEETAAGAYQVSWDSADLAESHNQATAAETPAQTPEAAAAPAGAGDYQDDYYQGSLLAPKAQTVIADFNRHFAGMIELDHRGRTITAKLTGPDGELLLSSVEPIRPQLAKELRRLALVCDFLASHVEDTNELDGEDDDGNYMLADRIAACYGRNGGAV